MNHPPITRTYIRKQGLTDQSIQKVASYPKSSVGPLQLGDHVVQNLQTGEQVTQWNMLHKPANFEFSFFHISQCVICSPVC